MVLPDVQVASHQAYHVVMEKASSRTALPTAVAHPCSAAAILAVVEAAEAHLIAPILVGPPQRDAPPRRSRQGHFRIHDPARAHHDAAQPKRWR
jgi:predicted alpha/beta hydrolase family esterase